MTITMTKTHTKTKMMIMTKPNSKFHSPQKRVCTTILQLIPRMSEHMSFQTCNFSLVWIIMWRLKLWWWWWWWWCWWLYPVLRSGSPMWHRDEETKRGVSSIGEGVNVSVPKQPLAVTPGKSQVLLNLCRERSKGWAHMSWAAISPESLNRSKIGMD